MGDDLSVEGEVRGKRQNKRKQNGAFAGLESRGKGIEGDLTGTSSER